MLQKGDTVKCADLDDMLETMTEMEKAGYCTDWDIEEIRGGEYILHVMGCEEDEKRVEY